jgi:hypothetical protein
MILYTLRCSADHHFEEWFSNSGEYDTKKEAGSLVCPECGDKEVGKAIMAPNVAKSQSAAPAPSCGTPMGCGGCPMAGMHG